MIDIEMNRNTTRNMCGLREMKSSKGFFLFALSMLSTTNKEAEGNRYSVRYASGKSAVHFGCIARFQVLTV